MNNSAPKAFVGSPKFQAGLTLCEGFNKRADLVMTGSVYSSVQSSNHIRARNRLECNGMDFKHGHLQKFDLDTFNFRLTDMSRVIDYVRREPFFETNEAIVYRFFHYVGDMPHVHGVIVTTKDHQLLRRFDREDLGLGRSKKSASVLDFCKDFVAHPGSIQQAA